MSQSFETVHSFGLVADAQSRILVLGTVPSPKSRELKLNYGNPRNRFWPVLGELFGKPVPLAPEEKLAFALAEGIALWDVLESCSIVGASDASITNARPNNIAWALSKAPIQYIFCTGRKAQQLYQRYIEPDLGVGCTALPSTSPANARMSLSELVGAYQPLVEALRTPAEPLAIKLGLPHEFAWSETHAHANESTPTQTHAQANAIPGALDKADKNEVLLGAQPKARG